MLCSPGRWSGERLTDASDDQFRFGEQLMQGDVYDLVTALAQLAIAIELPSHGLGVIVFEHAVRLDDGVVVAPRKIDPDRPAVANAENHLQLWLGQSCLVEDDPGTRLEGGLRQAVAEIDNPPCLFRARSAAVLSSVVTRMLDISRR